MGRREDETKNGAYRTQAPNRSARFSNRVKRAPLQTLNIRTVYRCKRCSKFACFFARSKKTLLLLPASRAKKTYALLQSPVCDMRHSSFLALTGFCVLLARRDSLCYAGIICYARNITERYISAGVKTDTNRQKQPGAGSGYGGRAYRVSFDIILGPGSAEEPVISRVQARNQGSYCLRRVRISGLDELATGWFFGAFRSLDNSSERTLALPPYPLPAPSAYIQFIIRLQSFRLNHYL